MNKQVIDVHMHIGGKGNSSPCKMSKRFLSSPAYLYMVVRSGIPLHKLLEDHDGVLRTTLIDRLNRAPSVDYGVFLAFDAVYKENGEVDEEKSHMITPNEYVMDIARNTKKCFSAPRFTQIEAKVMELKKLTNGLRAEQSSLNGYPIPKLLIPPIGNTNGFTNNSPMKIFLCYATRDPNTQFLFSKKSIKNWVILGS